MEIINSAVSVGKIRNALFDFDGTLSLLRKGWQEIMIDYMIEMIECDASDKMIRQEIENYVNKSAGVLTIIQMRGLASFVKQYGNGRPVLSPAEYKQGYVATLKRKVRERISDLKNGLLTLDKTRVAGSYEFLGELKKRNISMYVASGTDQPDVEEEMHVLEFDSFFNNHIYGAQPSIRDSSKATLIRYIIQSHNFEGPELLVVGDGPVEIKHGRRAGAITLGVATDEDNPGRLNDEKRGRLIEVGADIIISDFSEGKKVLEFLFPK